MGGCYRGSMCMKRSKWTRMMELEVPPTLPVVEDYLCWLWEASPLSTHDTTSELFLTLDALCYCGWSRPWAQADEVASFWAVSLQLLNNGELVSDTTWNTTSSLFGSRLIKPQGQERWGLPSNGHTWKPVWTLCVLHCLADFRNDNELSRDEWKRHKTIPRENSEGQHPISQVLMRTTDLALSSIYMRRWKFEETSLQYPNNTWCCTILCLRNIQLRERILNDMLQWRRSTIHSP